MEYNFLTHVANVLRSRRRQKRWMKVVSALACVVVFCITYALILPAITLEGTSYCGAEEHTHDDTCYEQKLICQLSDEVHTHGDECYVQQQKLVCTLPEVEAHTHSAACKTVQRTLTCTLEETAGHTHSDACKTTVRELICTEAESDTHAHDDSCYKNTEQLTCGLQESAGHAHSASCYTESESITCGKEETAGHTHSESCYETQKELQCDLEEGAAHVHGESCYEKVLTCTEEEHEHTLACYSNPEADLETSDIWERTLPEDEELSGVWAEDVLAIAESQLGYTESAKNYQVDVETGDLKGYTRYGAWYGDPYGHWCAMFASFCIDYAGVEDFPLESGCQRWIETLSEYETVTGETVSFYHPAEEYTPVPGDLIFFDADHMGLVVEIIEATETEPAQIKTIEGNSSNKVQYVTYELDSEEILGYAELPKQLTEAEQAEVDYVIQLIDEMPSADEIDAKIEEFEEAEDYEGEEAWYTEVCQQVAEAYYYYDRLTDAQKAAVTNADKLLELEYIWSVQSFAIETSQPTIYQINSYVDSTSEKSVMVFGGTVKEKVTYQFLNWYAVKVEKDSDDNYRVIEILQPGEDKSAYEANNTGFILLFYKDDTIPDASVGDKVTVNFVIPQTGAYKAEGYGTVSFTSALGTITSAEPRPIESVTTKDFVELNLYDYNSSINDKWSSDKSYPGFQWNGGAYSKSNYRTYYTYTGRGVPNAITDRNLIDSIDFGNSLITNFAYGEGSTEDYTKSTNATNVAKVVGSSAANDVGPINWIYGNPTEGYTNKPIGTSTDTDVMHETLINGYPALSNKTSLDWLFKSNYAVTQLNKDKGSIDGLFQFNTETGMYYYNSRENHAQYDAETNTFQLYEEIITPNFIAYPFGNFLPLNTIDDSSKATQVGAINYEGGMRDYVERTINDLNQDTENLGEGMEDTQSQLAAMLEEYAENWMIYPRTIGGVSYNWLNLTPANAIWDYFVGDTDGKGDKPSDNTDFITQEHLNNMYNIDWDVQTNFFFGMEMKMDFYQPLNGMTGKDNNKDGYFDYPMVFGFTGDDDVWVYIDDILFLDLSGIHRHVGGKIDFVNGKVYYYALTPASGDVNVQLDAVDVEKDEEDSYKSYTFADILKAGGIEEADLGKYLKKDADGNYTTFLDYSTHSFKFYYMERGSGSSVCRINFNFPLMQQHTITVEKELEAMNDNREKVDVEALGNPDFVFQIIDEDGKDKNGNTIKSYFENDEVPQWAYSLYDVDGSVIQKLEIVEKNLDGSVKHLKVYNAAGALVREEINGVATNYQENGEVLTVDENGCFTLKAGQKAQFVGIPEEWGKYYIKEWIPESLVAQYGDVTVTGSTESHLNYEDTVVIGGTTFVGTSSTIHDSNVSGTFEFVNKVKVSEFGSLSVIKMLGDHYSEPTAPFTFRVTLDGEPLPEGTTYAVGSETKTVTVDKDDAGNVTASYVELTAGETATISNILAGSQFEVTEVNADGYTVSYQVDDATSTTTDSATGTIGPDSNVKVKATNTQVGTFIEIPIWKNVTNNTETPHDYTFILQQYEKKACTSKVGDPVELKIEDLGKDDKGDKFVVKYLLTDVTEEDGEQTFYYKISEEAGTDTGVKYDSTYYIVEVTVTKDGTTLSANITNAWKNGTGESLTDNADNRLVFNNTIVQTITLSKTVIGGSEATENKEFNFTVALPGGEIPETVSGTLWKSATESEEKSYSVMNNEFMVALKDGEWVVLKDIPAGLNYEVTETNSDDFAVSYKVNTTGTETAGNSVTGTLSEDVKIAFTNTQLYSLPESGGAGTATYTMAGLMLMLCSAAYLLYRSKRRRGEAV